MVQLYKVVAKAGSVEHRIISSRFYEDALAFCEDHDWEYDYNGGLIWDLEIEEDGYLVVPEV